ncbi:CheR family methyltransferase [Bacteroidota bacterium]
MQNSIDTSEYQKINSFIKAKLGLNFPEDRKKDLEKALLNAASEFQFRDVSEFIQFLTTSSLSKSDFQILSKYLTIGETYFFREKVIFDLVRTKILPDIIAGRSISTKKLKIWSAGCSTGEEPYSIAMLINELIPSRSEWNITILATDLNIDIIGKARRGNYNEWSFRDVNPKIKEKYFTKSDTNSFDISPNIKNMVEFDYLNLVEDTYPSVANKTNAVDIIFCRNVLMYFDKERRSKVISAFYNSLVDGGWLILGLTEISYLKDNRYKKIPFKDGMIFQKTNETLNKSDKDSSTNLLSLQKSKTDSTKINSNYSGKSSQKSKSLIKEDLYPEAMKCYDDGNYKEAANYFIKYIDENPDKTGEEVIRAFYYLSMTLANIGELNSALKWCDKAISQFKLETSFYFLKSNLLQELNNYEDAISALQRAIYLDSDYIMAHFSLANIYRKTGKTDAANKQLRGLLAILDSHKGSDLVGDSDGMTVSRIKETIQTMLNNQFEK